MGETKGKKSYIKFQPNSPPKLILSHFFLKLPCSANAKMQFKVPQYTPNQNKAIPKNEICGQPYTKLPGRKRHFPGLQS